MRNDVVQNMLMNMNDKDLADVLEYVLERRVLGFEETFSALASHEMLLVRLRNAVTDWRARMAR